MGVKKNRQICISFKDTDSDIALYDYIKGKEDKSAYVKEVLKRELGIVETKQVVITQKSQVEPIGVVNGLNSISQFLD